MATACALLLVQWLARLPFVHNIIHKVLDQRVKVWVCRELRYRVRRRWEANDANLQCVSRSKLFPEEILWWGKIPSNSFSGKSSEDGELCPHLLEAWYHFLPLLFISFVSEKFFVRFHGTIFCVPPCVPQYCSKVEVRVSKCHFYPLAPNWPHNLGLQDILGGFGFDKEHRSCVPTKVFVDSGARRLCQQCVVDLFPWVICRSNVGFTPSSSEQRPYCAYLWAFLEGML